MHMVSIRVRYGFRWHSDKPYRTSRERVGLDGTLTSHIERVADEFDMACQSAI